MKRPFFPAPFRVTDFHGRTIVTDTPRKRRRLANGYEVSIPATTNTDLALHRMDSMLRMQDCWWSLVDKYSVPLDVDDEVDLFTGEVVRDRGYIRRMKQTYEIGDMLEGTYLGDQVETEESESGSSGRTSSRSGADDKAGGAWEEDEVAMSEDLSDDELGVWGEYSGLDEQYRVLPLLSTELDSEDERDLQEFEEAEQAMRERFGQQYLDSASSEEEFFGDCLDDWNQPPEENVDDGWTSEGGSDDEFAAFDHGEASAVRMLDSSDDEDELDAFLR